MKVVSQKKKKESSGWCNLIHRLPVATRRLPSSNAGCSLSRDNFGRKIFFSGAGRGRIEREGRRQERWPERRKYLRKPSTRSPINSLQSNPLIKKEVDCMNRAYKSQPYEILKFLYIGSQNLNVKINIYKYLFYPSLR